jgi:hypothetical protein
MIRNLIEKNWTPTLSVGGGMTIANQTIVDAWAGSEEGSPFIDFSAVFSCLFGGVLNPVLYITIPYGPRIQRVANLYCAVGHGFLNDTVADRIVTVFYDESNTGRFRIQKNDSANYTAATTTFRITGRYIALEGQ